MTAKEKVVKDEQSNALALVLSAIKKEYGEGSVFAGSTTFPGIEFIPTGCLSLDKALGGGFAKGRIAEIIGMESTGKSSLALHVTSEVQKEGGLVAYIDSEHALDFKYSKKLGVDVDKLIICQPSNAEEALNIANMFAESGIIDLIIVDSVAALVPRAEIEGDVGDSFMGLQARIMSQGLRKLTGVISKTNTTLIFINQWRQKIGIVYGSPEVATGGQSLKYYASQRIDMRHGQKNKLGDEIIGQTIKVKVIKNKVAQPFQETEFSIEHGRGINKYADLIKIACEKEIIKKSGSWYSYNEERLGQGESNVIDWLTNNPEIFSLIYDKCKI